MRTVRQCLITDASVDLPMRRFQDGIESDSDVDTGV